MTGQVLEQNFLVKPYMAELGVGNRWKVSECRCVSEDYLLLAATLLQQMVFMCILVHVVVCCQAVGIFILQD